MDPLQEVNNKLDSIARTQETQQKTLDELVDAVSDVNEAIKNINLTERDYEIDLE